MIITYPAVFKNNGEGYDVSFPDFDECNAFGTNPAKAIESAKKMLGAYASAIIESGNPLPMSTDLDEIEVPEDGYATYVEVNLKKFLTPTVEEVEAKKKKIKKIIFLTGTTLATATALGALYCIKCKKK